MTRKSAAQPLILIASRDGDGRASLSRAISNLGYKVRGTDALSTLLSWVRKDTIALVVLDVDLYEPSRNGFDTLQDIGQIDPACPVIALGGENTVLSSLLSARFGAVDFFARPYSIPSLLETIANHVSKQSSGRKTKTPSPAMPLIDRSKSMKSVLPLISKAARSNFPALIFGEVGTGKYLVANIMHKFGAGKDAKVITVMPSQAMAQIRQLQDVSLDQEPKTVIFRRLHHFCAESQSALCDWIDENEHSNNPSRVIATFDQGDCTISGEQKISPELLGRLQVLSIKMPALRHRRADIAELASEFLEGFSPQAKTLSDCAVKMLENLPWPGNVRQLKSFLAAASTQISAPVLDEADLQKVLLSSQDNDPTHAKLDAIIQQIISENSGRTEDREMNGVYRTVILAVERPLFELILEQENDNQLATAKRLGINRNTLRKKLLEHGLITRK